MADNNTEFLNPEAQIDSSIDTEAQIDSELNPSAELESELENVIEISHEYAGVDTEDIDVTVDNTNYTISAVLSDARKEQLDNIPKKTSDLTNDGDGESPFATQAYVEEFGGKIDSISVNGTPQTIDENKNVDITMPTKLTDLLNDGNFVQDGSYVHTDNNYTTEEKTKLSGVESGAQANIIETIKVNNSALTPSNKAVNIDLSAYSLISETGAMIVLEMDSGTFKITAKLKDKNGNVISTSSPIDLPLESVVVSGSYDATNQKIILTLENGNTIDIPVGALIAGLQTEITSQNKLDADLVDDTTSSNKFVSATEKNTWNAKYDKPVGGIPSSDLAESYYLSNNPNGFTKVESSNTNGNIKVDNNEVNVYTLPNDVARTSDIPDELADLTDDSTHRLVTDSEKETWNAKQDTITAGNNIDVTNNVVSAVDVVTTNTAQDISANKTIKDASLSLAYTGASGNASWQLEEDIYGQLAISRTYNGTKARMAQFNGNNFLPEGNNGTLGSASKKWKDLHLSGNLNDGTNSISVQDIADNISATAQNASDISDLNSNKVDKTSTANRLYGTNSNGEQTTVGWTQGVAGSYIVQRDGAGQIYVALLPTADNNAASKKYVDDRFNGASKTVAYADYSVLVEAVKLLGEEAYNIGQNIYVVTTGVPDLWVSAISSEFEDYTYTTDEALVEQLKEDGYVQVGYYKLSALETQKVDLTNYVTDSQLTQALALKADDSGVVHTTGDENVGGTKTFLGQQKFKKASEGGGYFYVSPDGNGYNAKIGFSSGGQMMIHNGGFQIDRSLYPMTANSNIDLGTSSVLWNNLHLKGSLKDGTNSIAIADIANKNEILLKPLSLSTTTMTDEQIATLRAYNCVLTNDLTLGNTSLKAGTILTVPFEYSNSLRGMAIYNNKIMTYYISLTAKTIGDGAQDIVISKVANIQTDKVDFSNQATITKDSSNRINLNYANDAKVKVGSAETTFKNRIGADSDNSQDIGRASVRWRDGFFAGKLKDGTNEISIAEIVGKQDGLVSGTNIKTINNESILGSGNITISGGGTATDVKVDGTSITSNNEADLQTINGDYNASTNKLATEADLPTVPTNVSAFTNDAGYLTSYTETDPTVPSWAKQSTKPTYAYSEITNTPDLSSFITNTVNDLVYYYTKSETYTQTEVNNLIAAIKTITYEIVSSLPTASSTTYFNSSKTVYMLAISGGSGTDYYDEYITVRSGSEGSYTYAWEKIGNTQIQLDSISNAEIDAMF